MLHISPSKTDWFIRALSWICIFTPSSIPAGQTSPWCDPWPRSYCSITAHLWNIKPNLCSDPAWQRLSSQTHVLAKLFYTTKHKHRHNTHTHWGRGRHGEHVQLVRNVSPSYSTHCCPLPCSMWRRKEAHPHRTFHTVQVMTREGEISLAILRKLVNQGRFVQLYRGQSFSH